MQTTQPQVLSISGQLVQGDVFTLKPQEYQGRPKLDKNNNQLNQLFFGVGVDKTSPDFQNAYNAMYAEAMQGFPGGEYQRQDFSWKFVDGDQPPNNQKPHLQNRYIFRFTSNFNVTVVSKGGASVLTDPNSLKRGYFVRVFFTVKANGDAGKPGVFLNPQCVELIGYGEEIISGPDPTQLIANAGTMHIPAGMMNSPVATGPAPQQAGGIPANPGQPAQPGMPPANPGQPAQPGMPAPPAQPYPQILDPNNPGAQ